MLATYGRSTDPACTGHPACIRRNVNCATVCSCSWDKTVRWLSVAATAADVSERFEFVMSSYWSDVTVMSLQCTLRVCTNINSPTDVCT